MDGKNACNWLMALWCNGVNPGLTQNSKQIFQELISSSSLEIFFPKSCLDRLKLSSLKSLKQRDALKCTNIEMQIPLTRFMCKKKAVESHHVCMFNSCFYARSIENIIAITSKIKMRHSPRDGITD